MAPIPVTPTAPLLPPLKEPVDVEPGEVLVDEPDTAEGVDVLLIVEPKPEVEVDGGPPEREVELPLPDVDEGKEEEEERAAAMSNWGVSESTVLTSPTGEAWKVYPEPGSTTGRSTVKVPSDVVTLFFRANVSRKASFVRYMSNVAGSPGVVVQVMVIELEE